MIKRPECIPSTLYFVGAGATMRAWNLTLKDSIPGSVLSYVAGSEDAESEDVVTDPHRHLHAVVGEQLDEPFNI